MHFKVTLSRGSINVSGFDGNWDGPSDHHTMDTCSVLQQICIPVLFLWKKIKYYALEKRDHPGCYEAVSVPLALVRRQHLYGEKRDFRVTYTAFKVTPFPGTYMHCFNMTMQEHYTWCCTDPPAVLTRFQGSGMCGNIS